MTCKARIRTRSRSSRCNRSLGAHKHHKHGVGKLDEPLKKVKNEVIVTCHNCNNILYKIKGNNLEKTNVFKSSLATDDNVETEKVVVEDEDVTVEKVSTNKPFSFLNKNKNSLNSDFISFNSKNTNNISTNTTTSNGNNKFNYNNITAKAPNPLLSNYKPTIDLLNPKNPNINALSLIELEKLNKKNKKKNKSDVSGSKSIDMAVDSITISYTNTGVQETIDMSSMTNNDINDDSSKNIDVNSNITADADSANTFLIMTLVQYLIT